jgi:hypothetical protein
MGYCITQVDSSFKIKEENLKPAYKAVKEQMADRAYHWNSEGWMKGLRDLVAVLEEWRYEAELDDETGDIVGLQFSGEKLGDEFQLFQVIAPFVEAGSYLEISGEDGTVWRWVFNGTTCEEKYADMSFEDKETFTLLVWELVPEDTEMYLIPNDVADTCRKYLDLAHGSYINGVGWQAEDKSLNQGLLYLNQALSDDDCGQDEFAAFKGILKGFKVDSKKPIVDTTVTYVYHSGFIL